MTNSGGIINIEYGDGWISNDAGVGTVWFEGTVTGVAAVPIPATAWLFGSALGILGWIRRKKS